MKFELLDKFRIKTGQWKTDDGQKFGLFFIPVRMPGKSPMKVMCSPLEESAEWWHVSVSLPNRCPTWDEMSLIKGLFFSDDDTVIQFHPKKEEYINNHPYCLHLWKNNKKEIELPPSYLVGLKGNGVEDDTKN